MSRKINSAVELVFDIIKLRFASYPVLPTDFHAPRWIIGNKSDEDWLAHCRIVDCSQVSPEKSFSIVSYQNKNYFITTGLGAPNIIPTGLNPFPINPGLFTALVYELELPLKSGVTNLMLEQNVLSQSKNDVSYVGHDYVDLQKYFPNIFVTEITQQFGGIQNNLFQIICVYLTSNKDYMSLPFSTKTLNKITDAILVNSDILNYESIAQALLSSHFKFAFLDLYRCIEMLYQIIYIDEAYLQLKLTTSKLDFLAAIDSNLSWKPNERATLNKIFSETPATDKASLIKTVHQIRQTGASKNIADWVYDLRCSIVHLKTGHIKFNITQIQWDEILYGISEILVYWYQKYPNFV